MDILFFSLSLYPSPSSLPLLLASWMREDKRDEENEEKEEDLDKKGALDFEHYNKQSKKPQPSRNEIFQKLMS